MAQAASNPAYTVSFQGQNNLSGDVRDLFLKLYAGEVLTAFEEKKVIMDKVRTRTISKGKSASFPIERLPLLILSIFAGLDVKAFMIVSNLRDPL